MYRKDIIEKYLFRGCINIIFNIIDERLLENNQLLDNIQDIATNLKDYFGKEGVQQS